MLEVESLTSMDAREVVLGRSQGGVAVDYPVSSHQVCSCGMCTFAAYLASKFLSLWGMLSLLYVVEHRHADHDPADVSPVSTRMTLVD